MKEFLIDRFLEGTLEADEDEAAENQNVKQILPGDEEGMKRFTGVCEKVKVYFDQEFNKMPDAMKKQETDLEKNAIIGYRQDIRKIKGKIQDTLGKLNLLNEAYPFYYQSLDDAIFSELYGWSGLTPWANDYTEEYRNSSSAKIIGDKLYCLIDGKAVLQPQTFPRKRREQLKRALLTAYPKERIEGGHNEVYLLREDGSHIRTTIMGGDFTYPDQDVLVFRKYIMSEQNELSFETLASYGTFPYEAIPLFKDMIKIGVNMYAVGPVRSGKTTFLQVWQHYEDPSLEGTTVSSDEETDYSGITDGPLVQIIADDKKLDQVEKSLKRLDSNYIIMSEVRSPAEYKFYLGITNMGTRRCKCTIHDENAINIPYKMATEIVTEYGGNQDATIAQFYSNIDYVFEMFEVPENRARKKLKGIVELRYDPVTDRCSAHRICRYVSDKDKWEWKYDIGDSIRNMAIGQENVLQHMEGILKTLESDSPLTEESVIYPAYYRGNERWKKA